MNGLFDDPQLLAKIAQIRHAVKPDDSDEEMSDFLL